MTYKSQVPRMAATQKQNVTIRCLFCVLRFKYIMLVGLGPLEKVEGSAATLTKTVGWQAVIRREV